MTDSPIHVAIAFDRAMRLPGLVLVSSIRDTATTTRQVVVHLLHDGLSADLASAVGQLERPGLSIELHDLGTRFADIDIAPPLSRAALFRLSLADELSGIGRVVYLDADTLVLRDLAELHDHPLGGRLHAAMADFPLYYFELLTPLPSSYGGVAMTYLRDRLGIAYSQPTDYFNSGVMVIDLEAWRAKDIARRCIDLIRQKGPFVWADQDALNMVCRNDWAPLDVRWNSFAAKTSAVSLLGQPYDLLSLQHSWRTDPWIVHFSGPAKPWHGDATPTVHDHLYWSQAAKTQWGRTLRRRWTVARWRLRWQTVMARAGRWVARRVR